jgi:hypothetical protein
MNTIRKPLSQQQNLQQQQPVVLGNQIPQGDAPPLERVTGPNYDMKFHPEHYSLMTKLNMTGEEADNLQNQVYAQYPLGQYNAANNRHNAMTEALKQRIKEMLMQRQQQQQQ